MSSKQEVIELIAEACAIASVARDKMDNGAGQIAIAAEMLEMAEQKMNAAKYQCRNLIRSELNATIQATLHK
jgi:hypothetical protein